MLLVKIVSDTIVAMKQRAVFQKPAENYEPRGHLDPIGFTQHVQFRTYAPTDRLAPFVEHFWVISWDREGQQPYISEQVMHRPYVDLFFSQDESGIQSTFRGRRDYRAEGAGRIIGARFKPGAFHAFHGGPLAGLYDKNIDVQQVFPKADAGFVDRVLGSDDTSAVRLLADLLEGKDPQPDPNIEFVQEIVAAVEQDSELRTVTDVAKRFAVSERWLQQLFSDYVGSGIKWLLQRKKLLEAAAYIRENEEFDWAGLAYDFGYSSQQHFITDFRRVLGKTPVQFKKELTR